MDILAHALWTNAAFYKKYQFKLKTRLLTALIGVLPDLASFTPATLYLFFSRQRFGPNLFSSDLWVFRYAAESYNYTHSLVIFIVVLAVVTAIRKGKVYLPMLGWGLHILIDIPTHKGFYETPFLFPVSDYRFTHGMPWAEPAFMFINYGALAIIYFSIIYFKRRRNAEVG